jgi:hypothetical protein
VELKFYALRKYQIVMLVRVSQSEMLCK